METTIARELPAAPAAAVAPRKHAGGTGFLAILALAQVSWLVGIAYLIWWL